MAERRKIGVKNNKTYHEKEDDKKIENKVNEKIDIERKTNKFAKITKDQRTVSNGNVKEVSQEEKLREKVRKLLFKELQSSSTKKEVESTDPRVSGNKGDGDVEVSQEEIFQRKVRKLLLEELKGSSSKKVVESTNPIIANNIIVCSYCNLQGHVRADCHNKVCSYCKVKGHSRVDCSKRECSECLSRDHWMTDCPKRLCRHCKQKGHARVDCPYFKECTDCKATDHWIRDCPNRTCSHCKRKGHASMDCPNRACSSSKRKERTTTKNYPNKGPDDGNKEEDNLELIVIAKKKGLEDKQVEQRAQSPVTCIPEKKIRLEATIGDEDVKKLSEEKKFKDKIRKLLFEELQRSSAEKEDDSPGASISGDIACDKCKQRHNATEDCPNQECIVCNATDHWIQDCPERICGYCKLKGHASVDCSKKGWMQQKGHMNRMYPTRALQHGHKQQLLDLLATEVEKKKTQEDEEEIQQSTHSPSSIQEDAIRPAAVTGNNECTICKTPHHWKTDCPKTSAVYIQCPRTGHIKMTSPKRECRSSRWDHTEYSNKEHRDSNKQQNDHELLAIAGGKWNNLEGSILESKDRKSRASKEKQRKSNTRFDRSRSPLSRTALQKATDRSHSLDLLQALTSDKHMCVFCEVEDHSSNECHKYGLDWILK